MVQESPEKDGSPDGKNWTYCVISHGLIYTPPGGNSLVSELSSGTVSTLESQLKAACSYSVLQQTYSRSPGAPRVTMGHGREYLPTMEHVVLLLTFVLQNILTTMSSYDQNTMATIFTA
jgi:hypothetical protein